MKKKIDIRIIRKGKCKVCKNRISYSREFDAFYCRHCDIWLESPCNDSRCTYCPNRPLTPNNVDKK